MTFYNSPQFEILLEDSGQTGAGSGSGLMFNLKGPLRTARSRFGGAKACFKSDPSAFAPFFILARSRFLLQKLSKLRVLRRARVYIVKEISNLNVHSWRFELHVPSYW